MILNVVYGKFFRGFRLLSIKMVSQKTVKFVLRDDRQIGNRAHFLEVWTLARLQ